MHCLIVADNPLTLDRALFELENLSDAYTGHTAHQAEQALFCLSACPIEVVLLFPGAPSAQLSQALWTQPPLSPPYLLGGADGDLPPISALPRWLEETRRTLTLPTLALHRLPTYLPLAVQLLSALDIPPSLRAWDFLPELTVLTMLHPPLLHDLQHFLYPLMARRHGLSVSAVERRLRLAVESTWNRGDYEALERFFGQSVDPDRGKPTNREFLCQLQQRLMLTVRRMQHNES